MVERHDPLADRINASDICSLVDVAPQARLRQVIEPGRPAVELGGDVVDGEGVEERGLRQPAVFAGVAGSRSDPLLQRRTHAAYGRTPACFKDSRAFDWSRASRSLMRRYSSSSARSA